MQAINDDARIAAIVDSMIEVDPLNASAARYDAERRMLVVDLNSGAQIAAPISFVPWLERYTDAQLADVTLMPTGNALRWEELDADVLVSVLLREISGVAAAARRGARARTPAKAAAVRENGKKGGRPRKAPASA